MISKACVAALPRRRAVIARYAGAVGIAIAAMSTSATALPTQSWNGYQWARSGPLVISLGDNVASDWDPYLQTAATEWTAANNIDFVVTAGRSTANSCRAVYGTVQACSWNYGKTGWLGYASVWLSGGYIVQATVKFNDYYFSQSTYNTAAWRQSVTCQEVGHTLGLAHNNTNKGDLNKGTCMDYSNDPSGLKGTANGSLDNLHPGASDFAALDGIYATLAGTQLAYTKPEYFAGDGYKIADSDHEHLHGSHAVTAVPEPSSWAMLIIGFGAVGAAMRQRPVRNARPLRLRL